MSGCKYVIIKDWRKWNKAMEYVFNQDSHIIIYGAATQGIILFNRLKNKLKIDGFIDKRADEINTIDGVPVWSLESKELTENIFENTVIIIAVKNVFQHLEIAYNIIKAIKLKKIICIPPEDKETYEHMKVVYNDIFYGDIENQYILHEICWKNKFEMIDYSNKVTVSGRNTCIVPVSLIYTNNNVNSKSVWNDIPIMAYFPHIQLFKYFDGDIDGDVNDYIEFCKNASGNLGVKQTLSWENNVVSNRKDIYNKMQLEYEMQSEFFRKNAPTAEWNENGYFNLTSGKHRAAFFASKCHRFMFLSISQDDYEKWINYAKVKKLGDYINQNNILKLPYPIDNPFFYRMDCEQDRQYFSFWCKIVLLVAKYLYRKYGQMNFGQLKLYNELENNQYILDYYFRKGAKIYNKCESKVYDLLVNDIYYCKLKRANIKSENYDFAFVKEYNLDTCKKIKSEFYICNSIQNTDAVKIEFKYNLIKNDEKSTIFVIREKGLKWRGQI